VSSTVTIIGNLTGEPELRYTPSGQPTASFNVAANRRFKRADGEWEESVCFWRVTCWGTSAENAAESLPKGTRVVVTGRVEQREWTDKEGVTRKSLEVVADEIGASVRYATLNVTRNERTGTQPAAASTARQSAPSGTAAGYEYGEEPF
jgi:single-strand DNA-binding protein